MFKRYWQYKLKKQISHIVAIAQDGVIGVDNDIPWKCKSDMYFFKKTTTGHVVVMGRRTWESLPRKLSDRVNIVISASMEEGLDGGPDHILRDVANIQDLYYTHPQLRNKKVFIIGGASIYSTTMDLVRSTIVSHLPMKVYEPNNTCDVVRLTSNSPNVDNLRVARYDLSAFRGTHYVCAKWIAMEYLDDGTQYAIMQYDKK